MEKVTRVQEIRKRFEGLNSRNNDSSHPSQKQLRSDLVNILPRTGKQPSENECQNKAGIKRSHAFRSDKSKVKPLIGTSVSNAIQCLNSSTIQSVVPREEHRLQTKSNVKSSNILKPPNVPLPKPLPRKVDSTKSANKPEVLSDTLKKALQNPLPIGPAPKKPPRTFVHGGRSFDFEDTLNVHKLNQLSSNCGNKNNVPHKNAVALAQRSKTEPHIMLKKLESALLSNQVNNNIVKPKLETSLSTGTNKGIDSTTSNKFSSLGARTLCLNGLTSCLNPNIYDTPLEYKGKVRSEAAKNKGEKLPHQTTGYGKILADSRPIYDEPYSPKSERKLVLTNERPVKTPSPKPSLHYASSPIRENRRISFEDTVVTVSSLQSQDEKIKMITDPFDNPRSDSDADSAQEEKTGNNEEATAARKTYVKRVSLMRRPTCHFSRRDNLFEALLLIGIDQDLTLGKVPYIKSKYPETVEVPQGLEGLVFPDAADWPPIDSNILPSRKHNNYTLTLTADDATRKYAYCRRLQPEGTPFCLPLAYVIVTMNKDNLFYYSILSELEMRHGTQESEYLKFASDLFHSNFPKPGFNLRIDETLFHRPSDSRRDCYDISTLLQGATVPVFIKLFSTLLHERKVILVGSNISVVSDCIEGLQKSLFPFEWEHVLVGAVPFTKLEFCEAPIPFLMGVIRPKQNLQNAHFLPLNTIDNCLVVDVETGEMLQSCGDESSLLPSRLASCLRSALYLCPVHGSDVGPSEALIRLFVELIGHYNSHVVTNVHTNNRAFQKETFVKAHKSQSVQLFLDWFTETAMFQAFIQKRLDRSFEPGLFEQRCAEYVEENIKNHNISRKEKSLNKTVRIIDGIAFGFPLSQGIEKLDINLLSDSARGDRFKDWTS